MALGAMEWSHARRVHNVERLVEDLAAAQRTDFQYFTAYAGDSFERIQESEAYTRSTQDRSFENAGSALAVEGDLAVLAAQQRDGMRQITNQLSENQKIAEEILSNLDRIGENKNQGKRR